jgi:hypothetical protein
VLTVEQVKKVAALARLELPAADLATMADQLNAILGYVDQLAAVNTDGVEPMAHPTRPCKTPPRGWPTSSACRPCSTPTSLSLIESEFTTESPRAQRSTEEDRNSSEGRKTRGRAEVCFSVFPRAFPPFTLFCPLCCSVLSVTLW